MTKREPKWYIDNKLKPPKAFFDWCYSQIPTHKWTNKNETIENAQRTNCYVVEKRLTKRTKLTFFDRFYSFAIVLVTSARIEIQSYGFWSSYENGQQNIEMQLSNFEQYAADEIVKVSQWNNRYGFGLLSNYGFMSGPYTNTRFYENDWRKKIKDISELKYLKFDEGIEREDLEHYYKYKFEIEFLQKINAKKLASEVMYPSHGWTGNGYETVADMRTISPKWLKENKNNLKNTNKSFKSYELEQRIRKRNGKIVPGIEKYLNYRDINKIPKCVGIVSFQNWVIKNEIEMGYYYDYLSLLKDLNITVNTKNLAMPKDLVAAHDNAVELLNQTEREVSERKYAKRLKKLQKLEKDINDLKFIVPKSAQELIREGKQLSHCVGGSRYVEGHREGKMTIVFIRKKDDPNKSFYTLEYKNNHIVQIRGKHNKTADESIWEVANEWLEAVAK